MQQPEKQILIGTCIPGNQAEEWMPPLLEAGFETASINYHMSLEGADLGEQGPRLKAMAEERGAVISTLGYYCNPIADETHFETLKQVIDAAQGYGASVVSTFAGAYTGQSVDTAFTRFGEVFRELAQRAADNGVRLAIENCPMGGTWHSTTCNIGFNPKAWERMFNEVTHPALGLEWEPAHQLTQLIDPIAQLRKWVGKVVHVHGKDATVDMRSVADYGVLPGVEVFARERTPGFGDTNWRDVIYILHMAGYTGDICVEGYHDPFYCGDWEMTAQLHALQYLKWCRGGDFSPNPW